MNTGIAKKFIFSYFLLINFIQLGQTSELQKISKNNNQVKNLNLFNISDKKSFQIFPKLIHNNFKEISIDKKLFNKNAEPFFADISQKQKELVIQSDKQSEINGFLYAEGNVSVSYKGNHLKADNLTYDKLN